MSKRERLDEELSTTQAVDDGRELMGNVGRRKSEWKHCVPDGLVTSPHLDATASIRGPIAIS